MRARRSSSLPYPAATSSAYRRIVSTGIPIARSVVHRVIQVRFRWW
ncbi:MULTISPECIES: hypothetical protein [Streptomyces]|nr:hypothetical protein [Streptomyces canarius]